MRVSVSGELTVLGFEEESDIEIRVNFIPSKRSENDKVNDISDQPVVNCYGSLKK